jgi:hypothetical protein
MSRQKEGTSVGTGGLTHDPRTGAEREVVLSDADSFSHLVNVSIDHGDQRVIRAIQDQAAALRPSLYDYGGHGPHSQTRDGGHITGPQEDLLHP